jgi:hypothetical protein
MSLLSSFISNQLIKAIENEFVNHSPEIQATIISEIQAFLAEGAAWVESKISGKSETSTGESAS